MLVVDNLTELTLQQRFSALPASLQKALTSEDAARSVTHICADNGISDPEDVLTITQLATFVVLGLLSTDDLTSEIDEALSLSNPDLAGKIAGQLSAKIFAPIRGDIEKNYQPLPGTPSTTTDISAPTVKKQEGQSIPKPPTIQAPPSTQKPFSDIGIPVVNQTSPRPMPAPINDLSSKGWSHMAPTNFPPVTKNPAVFPLASVPVPVPTPAPNKISTPTPAPAPAPMMIQRGESFAAPARNADFHLERKMGAQMDLESVKIQPKARPAMIEFGQAKGAPSPTTSGTVPAPKRTDAYSEFSTPLSSIPITKSGDRNVVEITAELKVPAIPAIPQPPLPPKPPASSMGQMPLPPKSLQTPPAPPRPSAPPLTPDQQTPKVIIKNFT